MNDMVSIRKMRSLAEALFFGAGGGGAAAGELESGFEDFFRGGKEIV